MDKTVTKSIENSSLYYILLFLSCINAFMKGSVFCLVLGIFVFLFLGLRYSFDKNAIILFLFAFSAIVSLIMFESDANEIIKILNYLFMYLAGYNGYKHAINKGEFIKRSAFTMFFGMGLFIAITLVFNLRQNIFNIYNNYRVMLNIWSGEFLSVTLAGALTSVVIAYSFYALFGRKGKKIKLLAFVMMGAAFLLNFYTATRTPFVMFVLVYVIMAIIYVSDNGKHTLALWILFALFAVIALVIVLVYDVFGLRTYLESTRIFVRFDTKSLLQDGRIENALLYIQYLKYFSWGGNHVEPIVGKAAHNYLLQAYDLYGVLAFTFICLLTISFMVNIVRIIQKKGKIGMDLLLIAFYIAIFFQCMFEPILTAYPILFWCLLLLHGMATAYIEDGMQLPVPATSTATETYDAKNDLAVTGERGKLI